MISRQTPNASWRQSGRAWASRREITRASRSGRSFSAFTGHVAFTPPMRAAMAMRA